MIVKNNLFDHLSYFILFFTFAPAMKKFVVKLL